MAEIILLDRKGGKVLLHNGRQFHKKKDNKNKTTLWRCSNNRKLKCSGHLTISEDYTSVLKATSHVSDCVQDEGRNIVDTALAKCKNQVEATWRPIATIYDECVVKPMEEKGIDLVATVPSLDSKKSGYYKARNKKAEIPKVHGNTLLYVKVPNFHSDFVLCDYVSVPENRRIIVFCTQENRAMLGKAKHVFCDGTFQSCPSPFQQLYSLHADLGSTEKKNNIRPLLYVFMTDRKQISYEILFQLIHSQIPEFNPIKFTLDLERAAINAIAKIFPSSIIKSCYYHYKANLWKKGQELGMTKFKIIRRVILLCGALALLPTKLINKGWEYINKSLPLNYPQVQIFVKYMQFWLKNKKMHNIWSAYGERHRTNNCVENWHKNLNKKLNCNIVTLLNVLRQYAKVKKRYVLSTRKRQNIDNDKFIQESQLELLHGDITVGHFLEMLK